VRELYYWTTAPDGSRVPPFAFVSEGCGLCCYCDTGMAPGDLVIPRDTGDPGPVFGDDYFHEECFNRWMAQKGTQ
jgi:hypothetical protein